MFFTGSSRLDATISFCVREPRLALAPITKLTEFCKTWKLNINTTNAVSALGPEPGSNCVRSRPHLLRVLINPDPADPHTHVG